MAYSPPVGTVNLSLTGSYTPPVGVVTLSLGFDPTLNRTVAIIGVTMAPTGRLRIGSDSNLLSAVSAH